MIAVNDDERRHSLLAFVGAGLAQPPAKALVVGALAAARRTAAAYRARHEPIDDWLASEIRLRGIREAVAFVAALEIAERRADVAQMYRHRYPDRSAVLDKFLMTLDT